LFVTGHGGEEYQGAPKKTAVAAEKGRRKQIRKTYQRDRQTAKAKRQARKRG